MLIQKKQINLNRLFSIKTTKGTVKNLTTKKTPGSENFKFYYGFKRSDINITQTLTAY